MWMGLSWQQMKDQFNQQTADGTAWSLVQFLGDYTVFGNVWDSYHRLEIIRLCRPFDGQPGTRYRKAEPARPLDEPTWTEVHTHWQALLAEMFPEMYR